jgi:hypothetical protein
VSTVPAVQAALVALFRATFPTDTTVTYGPKGTATYTENNVITVEGAAGTVEVASLNMREREDYVIPVAVSVTIPSGSMQAAVEAADAMWATAKAALRNPPGGSLNVTGVASIQPIGGFELTETPSSDAPNAAIRFGVHVLAQ